MNNNALMWGAIAIVIVVGGIIFLANRSGSNQQNSQVSPTSTVQVSPTPVAASAEDETMKKKMEIMESAMKDKDSLKATLTDVNGGAENGEAFNLRKNGKLLHTATAHVSDPANGSFYEGWIVNKATNQFVSTGKLERQKDGSWEVSTEFDQTYDGYNFIIITLETIDDQKPEKHILEGVAQ